MPAVDLGRPVPMDVPPILPGYTFHEGRHIHQTWLADDGIPEVGRAARLGQSLNIAIDA
ncbi:site-specific integrase [Actinoallomurus bryophytorum]|uniref:hypothetical protein n=1 Tax=Actinoallomurus bryophytorum TaxID=1490222 RepID=UPI001C88F887|nr:hypothetical protein [Actinoallomurus bryophytorum]